MKDQDYELISQYIDGELAPEQAQEIRRRLLAEPELRSAYDDMRHVDSRVRQAFEGTWAQ